MKSCYSVIILLTRIIFISAHNKLEEQLLNLLESWKTGNVHNASHPFPLPSLQLIVIPQLDGIYEDSSIELSYSTNKMELTGLDNFIVTNIKASSIKLEASMRLVFPLLRIQTDNYKIKGDAYFVYSLNGSGNMWAKLTGVEILLKIRLGASGNGTAVKDLQFQFTVEQVNGELEGNSYLLNKLLNKQGTQMLMNNHDNIVGASRSAVIPIFNEYLAKVTPKQLLKEIAQFA